MGGDDKVVWPKQTYVGSLGLGCVLLCIIIIMCNIVCFVNSNYFIASTKWPKPKHTIVQWLRGLRWKQNDLRCAMDQDQSLISSRPIEKQPPTIIITSIKWITRGFDGKSIINKRISVYARHFSTKLVFTNLRLQIW